MAFNHLILCHSLHLLPSIFPSTGVFSSESALRIMRPKYWRFSFSTSPSSKHYSISLQSKGLSKVFSSATVHKHQFFGAQPSLWSNSHIHRWLLKKTIASTIWTFVGKVMSLLFNTLSRFFIVFLQGASILSSWLQSLSAVILESKNIKSITVSTFPPFICHEVTDGMSCIHTYFRFLFNIFHYKVFSRAPCAIQWVLISYLFHVICRKQSYGYHGGKGEGR